MLKQMPIQIPCSEVECMWIGMPDLAVVLGQEIGEAVEGNWWAE